jgi:hypothetical protein
MKEIRFAVPDEFHTHFAAQAEGYGFLGRCAVSNYARHVAFQALGKDPIKKPQPIIVQPTYEKQRIELEAYAKVKGYASLEAYGLEAMAVMMRKNALTATQEAEYTRMVAEALYPHKAVELGAIAGNLSGGR